VRFLVDESTGSDVARWLRSLGHDTRSVYDEKSHAGVILLRIEDERPANKKAVLEKLLQGHGEDIPGSFVVVTEDAVRITRFSSGARS
jgi:hypothetical protein